MHELARLKWCIVWVTCGLLICSGCESSAGLDVNQRSGDAASDTGATDTGQEDTGSSDESVGDASTDTEAIGEPDTGDDVDSGEFGPADTGSIDTGSIDSGTSEPEADPRFEVAMTFTTANIGRNYSTKSDVQAVFNKIGDVIGAKSGPKYIGWQEIGGGDPCGGTCEIEALRNRFKGRWGWTTRDPRGTRPNGRRVRSHVPITSKGASNNGAARATFASPAWERVSVTRFVTVVRYPNRNISMINTHFIAGAWSCKPNLARRRDYWRRAWNVLEAEVAKEHDRGHNVIVTGDLNRPRRANNCNPAWNPTSLHRRARIIGGAGIDYIFAVPSAGHKFVVSRRPNGNKMEGSIHLGIDGHKAHWVRGKFLPK